VSAVRPPVIAGLTAGAGTSTLAAALHARDGGLLGHRAAGEADVVVCGSSEASLREAGALACAPSGPRPVLAVVHAVPDASDVAGLVRRVRPRYGAVVVLPHVARWHGLAVPRDEAAAVLALPSDHLTSPVRVYAAALRTLVGALAGSGLLERTAPPLITRPQTVTLWRGLQPVERVAPTRPVRLGAVTPEPELDDEAIEAGPVRPAVGAGRAG
jgi:hypothetical protein